MSNFILLARTCQISQLLNPDHGHSPATSGTSPSALPRLPVAQGDVVRLGDLVGLDGPEPLAQALAGLPKQLEGIGGRARRRGTLRIGPVFFDEVGLQGCGDFVGRLQRVVDGPVPCCVFNHAASIPSQRSRENSPARVALLPASTAGIASASGSRPLGCRSPAATSRCSPCPPN